MNPETWLAFVLASSALLAIPGPTILTVISYSISHGSRVKLALIAAVALGDSTALALSLLGLSTLLAQSAFWFQTIKWAGGLYLLYLGLKLLLSHSQPLETAQPEKRQSKSRLFRDTYLVTALNPKGIIFFVAFLPQFIRTDAPAGPQMFLLAATFVLLAAINTSLYALLASHARQLFSSVRAQRIFNISGGSLMSTAGIWALTARQN